MNDYAMAANAEAAVAQEAARAAYFASDRSAFPSVTGQIAAGRQLGEPASMRSQLHELDKLLADATATVRSSADSLFGDRPLMGSKLDSASLQEPSINDLLETILGRARELHGEASRLVRIG